MTSFNYPSTTTGIIEVFVLCFKCMHVYKYIYYLLRRKVKNYKNNNVEATLHS